MKKVIYLISMAALLFSTLTVGKIIGAEKETVLAQIKKIVTIDPAPIIGMPTPPSKEDIDLIVILTTAQNFGRITSGFLAPHIKKTLAAIETFENFGGLGLFLEEAFRKLLLKLGDVDAIKQGIPDSIKTIHKVTPFLIAPGFSIDLVKKVYNEIKKSLPETTKAIIEQLLNFAEKNEPLVNSISKVIFDTLKALTVDLSVSTKKNEEELTRTGISLKNFMEETAKKAPILAGILKNNFDKINEFIGIISKINYEVIENVREAQRKVKEQPVTRVPL